MISEGNINVSFVALISHNLVHVWWLVEKKKKMKEEISIIVSLAAMKV